MIESKQLAEIVSFYLGSGDFNGLRFRDGELTESEAQELADLLRQGLVEATSVADYPNPSIRPWKSKRTVDDQLEEITRIGSRDFCVYPTALAMNRCPDLWLFPTEPYRHRMAGGSGTLELAYFDLDVIEPYRNDPRFHYWSSDVSVHLGIGDEAFLDPDEPEKDKITSLRLGFAYDPSTIQSSQIRRSICAFVGDLSTLTSEHQQRWRTFELASGDGIEPHPTWWSMQMGHWPEAVGPFQRILEEIKAINELFTLAYGEELFSTSDHPREWGWVLRSSTVEWEQFILASDKLLSDNLRKKALDAARVSTTQPDGRDAGTLTRLGYFLESKTPCPKEVSDEILAPLKRVRAERQKPAHKLSVAKTDQKVTAQQRDLLSDVGHALQTLREVLSFHPKAAGWKPRAWLTDGERFVV